MLKKSAKVALGGMAAALCVLLMFMTGFFPFATYALPALAGFLIIAVVLECGFQWAAVVYIAVSILSVLTAPDRQAAAIFVAFFGHYPILKGLIERLRLKTLRWVLKFFVFNVCTIAGYYAMIYVFKIPDALTDLGDFGKYTAYIMLGLGNIVFLVFDIALTRVITAYKRWFRPKFLKKIG